MDSCNPSGRTTEHIGTDQLLRISTVAERFEVCPVTASKIMDETGHSIVLHRKKYVLESSLYAYLHEQEAM